MADKYWSVTQVANDVDLQQRVTSCAAVENIPDPAGWAMRHVWDYASQPSWGETYQYALDTGTPNPGRDDTVITDAMVLAAVQAIRAEEPGPET